MIGDKIRSKVESKAGDAIESAQQTDRKKTAGRLALEKSKVRL